MFFVWCIFSPVFFGGQVGVVSCIAVLGAMNRVVTICCIVML